MRVPVVESHVIQRAASARARARRVRRRRVVLVARVARVARARAHRDAIRARVALRRPRHLGRRALRRARARAMSEALFHCENYFHIGAYAECVDAARACADADGVDAVRRDAFVARSRVAMGEGEVRRRRDARETPRRDRTEKRTRRSSADRARERPGRRRTDETAPDG